MELVDLRSPLTLLRTAPYSYSWSPTAATSHGEKGEESPSELYRVSASFDGRPKGSNRGIEEVWRIPRIVLSESFIPQSTHANRLKSPVGKAPVP